MLTANRSLAQAGKQRAGRARKSLLERASAVRMVEAAYVMVLGFLVVRLVYTLLTPLNAPGVIETQRAERAPVDLAVFGRFDPFAGRAPSAPVPRAEPVRETTLNLKLLGVVSSDEGRASAIISVNGGAHRPFAVGETVTDGVSIDRIGPERVILDRRGQTESLSLAGRESGSGMSGAAPSPYAAETREPPRADPMRGARQLLTNAVRIQGDPQGRGLVLYPGRDPVFFNASGLVAGDRLVAVSGQPVGTDLQAIINTLVASFSQGQSVAVTVDRDGNQLQLSIDPPEL